MKEFYDKWSDQEIEEYLEASNVLVLFETNHSTKTAELKIHGKMTDHQRMAMLENILNVFGGAKLAASVCAKINEYAEKWYNKNVLKRKARVININKKG